MNTKKEKKVVLLQIDKRFIDEEFKQVDEALEYAKIQFQQFDSMKEAKAFIATVIEGYVKRKGELNKEIVYIDLEEQKTIINKPKQIANE